MKIYCFHVGMPYRGMPEKLILVLKLTTFLLLITIMQVSARTFAQNINLSEHNANLVKIFKEIKAQSGYSFVYTAGELKNAKLVNINVTSERRTLTSKNQLAI